MNERDVKYRIEYPGYMQVHRYGNCPCDGWHTLGAGLPAPTWRPNPGRPLPAPTTNVFRPILAKAQYTAASLRALAAKLEAQHGPA